MLHEILDIEIQTEDFVRIDESGNKWLTTQNLLALNSVKSNLNTIISIPEWLAIVKLTVDLVLY